MSSDLPSIRQETAIAKKDPMSNLRDLLERMSPQLQRALPSHLKAERMIRVATTAVQINPKLQECSARSIIACVVEASQLGLEPCGALGHAYLVPYVLKGVPTCQLMVGYKGLVDLVRRSGNLKTISANVVYESDDFQYRLGLNPDIHHVPSGKAVPGQITHVYAVANLMNGGVQFDVMTIREVESLRKRSRSANNGPWVTDYEAMAKKTVIRRLAKLLPVSVEVQRAVEIDERDDSSRKTVVSLADELQLPHFEGDRPEPILLTADNEEIVVEAQSVDSLDAMVIHEESKAKEKPTKPKGKSVKSVDDAESPPDDVVLREVENGSVQ